MSACNDYSAAAVASGMSHRASEDDRMEAETLPLCCCHAFVCDRNAGGGWGGGSPPSSAGRTANGSLRVRGK